MKTFLALFLLVLACGSALADDVADAQKEFAKYIEYQTTDDERSPELFAKSGRVVVTLGDAETTKIMPMEAFIEAVKQGIKKKAGSSDTYTDVKYEQGDQEVRVTAVRFNKKSGRKGPFGLLYRRDADGVLRVHEIRVTLHAGE